MYEKNREERTLKRVLLFTVLFLGFLSPWVKAAEDKLPSFVDWSYKGAFQEDNGCRAKICLNGWWRWLAD